MATNGAGRGILVTGASTGIGRALALRLDALGFRVFAAVRKEADQASFPEGARLTPIRLDVTDARSIAAARAAIAASLGDDGLFGLINNAGLSFRAPLEFVPLEELRALFEVNVFGALAVTQAFLPLLRRAKGRVVNISSFTATSITPFHGPYSSSKATLNALSEALRLELKPLGVDVAVMVVGGVRTPLWEKAADATERIVRQLPAERLAPYAERQRAAFEYFRRRGTAGLTPEAAADLIARSLTDARPKRNYFVGCDAVFYHWLNFVLRGRLRDFVILRMLRPRPSDAPAPSKAAPNKRDRVQGKGKI